MPTRPPAALVRSLLAMAVFACCAFAQPPAANKEQVLYFEPSITAQNAQEIVIAIRTLSTGAQISFDEAQRAVTVRGTAGEIAVAGWVFHQLEAPSGGGPPAPTPASLVVPGAADDVVRVFYPANIKTPEGLQQLVIAIRTIGEIQRMMACNGSAAVVLRGTAAQAALAEWLVNALDKLDGWKPPASQSWAAYEYQSSPPGRGGYPTAVRVFYASNTEAGPALQEIVTATRTLTDQSRLIAYNPLGAVVLRGTPGQVALSEWLLNALDKPDDWQPPAGQNPVAYQYNDNDDVSPMGGVSFVRVFYLPTASTQQDLLALVSQIRVAASCQRVLGAATHHVLELRGTAAQVTTAEQLVAARYPPSPKP